MSKLRALIESRRFWAAVAGVVIVASEQLLPGVVDQESVERLVLLIGAWIVGDSLRQTV